MGKEAAPPWGECRGRQYMAVGRSRRRRCCRRGGNPPSPDGSQLSVVAFSCQNEPSEPISIWRLLSMA